MIKRFLPVILLAAGLEASWGFALLGPTGNGGDSWQTAVIGYDLAHIQSPIPGGPVFLQDIGAPKNIGEEYRRNTPLIYYAYDANYLGFFGSNGVAAADSAYAIMNSLTNVSSYSSDLSEFPTSSQHYNYQAQALYLTDVKSVTLHLLVEQLGLAAPERFTWTLAERYLPSGGTCPADEIYLVLQRNFNIIPTAPTQIQYSSYVNNVLYTYEIIEDCTGPNPLAYTVVYSVDPLAEQYTAVAANDNDGGGGFGGFLFGGGGGLQIGGYYTGLTRDDVGGFRYLLNAGNINTEDAAAGSLLQVTNLSPQQVITTLPLGLFLSQVQTNDPVTLQTLYPGLIISSSTTNYLFVNTTNVIAYYTNQPGPSVTNYSPTLLLLTNLDFSLFLSQAKTSPPAALQALYPSLLIVASSQVPTGLLTVSNPVVLTYLTNGLNGSPYPSSRQVTVTNGYTFAYFPTYSYTFGNILTNTYSTSNNVTFQTISVTNLIGSPYGSPNSTNTVNVSKYLTNSISGDFFIIPTNWCGYSILATGSVQKVSSYTNVQTSAASTNSLGSAQFSQSTIFYYTNRVYAVFPGVCEPALVFATNTLPTVVTNYAGVFANIQIVSSNGTTPVTLITTNIGSCSNGIAGILCTNVTSTNFLANTPSGDFFIVPAAWNCGYAILSTQSVNRVGFTNTVITPVSANVTDLGQQYSVTTISYYTNRILVIQPIVCQTTAPGPALREGIERIQFARANYDSLVGQFFQPITNSYTMVKITNSQAITEYYQRIITQPDILMTANNQIAGNTFNGTVERTINFDTANVLPGLAGPGVINSPVAFSYNKIGNAFDNGSLAEFASSYTFLGELTQVNTLAWASFDGSTNAPIVYPNGNSIQNLENQILVQITPTTLADGTLNSAYPAVTFAATGGSFTAPFTWSASGLPPGLSVSSGGTLSGTPTLSGTYDFTLQLTDSLGRSVQWFYTLNIP